MLTSTSPSMVNSMFSSSSKSAPNNKQTRTNEPTRPSPTQSQLSYEYIAGDRKAAHTSRASRSMSPCTSKLKQSHDFNSENTRNNVPVLLQVWLMRDSLRLLQVCILSKIIKKNDSCTIEGFAEIRSTRGYLCLSTTKSACFRCCCLCLSVFCA